MPAKKVLHGSEYCLPECEFIAPEGKQFKAWQIDGTEYPVNAPVTVTADITGQGAVEDAPPAPVEYTVTVTTEGSGTASASSTSATAGTEIRLTATPKTDYHFKEWEVISGGVTIVDDKFTMPEGNVEVKAIFEEDAPPAPTEFIVTFDGNGGTPSVGSMTTTDRKLTSLPAPPEAAVTASTAGTPKRAAEQRSRRIPYSMQMPPSTPTGPTPAAVAAATIHPSPTTRCALKQAAAVIFQRAGNVQYLH